LKTIKPALRVEAELTLGPFQLIAVQWQVLVAVMLRDIKTRFFGNEFGFLIAIAWPLSHVLILLLINTAAGRVAPYGDSAALWFATGVIPFMAFAYMSRFIMLGIVLNRPLLIFPRVKITDILLARAIIEILSAGVVVIILAIIFWAYGINFTPINPVQACFALGASMLLGLGVGVINAIVAAAIPIWVSAYNLVIIFLWITSGVFFVAHALPEALRYPLSFNPIVHAVEWMRAAYYEGYGDSYLDKSYLIGYGTICLCYGLLLERLVRGRLLQT
jgi:capsular polysaccharide transport system permease protein